MKRIIIISVFLLVAMTMSGQENGIIDNIIFLTGAQGEESLSEEVLERFEALARRPVDINLLSERKLLSTGLFSRYQTASLEDYRSRSGDVLSAGELATLDGFGEDFVRALRPFISFHSSRLPGDTLGTRTDNSLTCGILWKKTGWREDLKYKYSARDRMEIAAAFRSTYENRETGGFYAVVYGRKHLGKVIFGDFNARFGQGLALWSGFSLSGFSSPETFARRPSGLSPSWSYSTGNFRGLAMDLVFGRMTMSMMAAAPGLRPWMEDGKPLETSVVPAVNLAWFGKVWDVSVTGMMKTGESGGPVSAKLASDFRACLKGTDIFGEVAGELVSGTVATVLGTSVPVGKSRIGMIARNYPSAYDPFSSGAARAWTKCCNERGAALAISRGGLAFSADMAMKPESGDRQLKLLLSDRWDIGGSLAVKMRLSGRIRNHDGKNRTDCRSDICWSPGKFLTNVRINFVSASRTGFLMYVEPGYKDDVLSVYMRGTVFFADSWDDRVYCYERDAPGSFNVPAYYGRGFSAGIYGTGKFEAGRCRIKACLKALFTAYPWQIEKKPATCGLHIQIMCDF